MQLISECYTVEIAEKLGHMHPDQRTQIEASLKAINEEEARTARLFASGKITEAVWDNLWAEWQDRRRTLRRSLESVEQQAAYHISHLDDALHIIARIDVLLERLDAEAKKDLLREIINRVVVNSCGKVVGMELLPPFSYLDRLSDRVRNGITSDNGKKETKTSIVAGNCSNKLPTGGPEGLRYVN